METLKRIIEHDDTKLGRIFDLTIQALIVVSLVSFSVETLPGLPATAQRCLRWIEIMTVAIFTVEYILRIIVADQKLRFIFSFFGLVDLLSILPFYLATGVDLRSVRAFRLLRLFRAFKLVRYNKAIRRFHCALLIAREELVLYLLLALMLLSLSAVGIYYFEHDAQPEQFASVFHSLWWAVATLTTVGYGDVYPVTAGGRVFTFIILLAGRALFRFPPAWSHPPYQRPARWKTISIADPRLV